MGLRVKRSEGLPDKELSLEAGARRGGSEDRRAKARRKRCWRAKRRSQSAVPPEGYLEDVDSSPTARVGTTARVAKTVLRATRRAKGQRETLKHAERREREGGTGDGSLASRRGRCGCIYTSRTSMLRQNELEQKMRNRVRVRRSDEVEVSRRHAARR